MGNIHGTLMGTNPDQAPVWCDSHVCWFFIGIMDIMDIREETETDLPHSSDDIIMAAIEECCERKGIAPDKVISGAYRNYLYIAAFTPEGMRFVPGPIGDSYDPAEYTDINDAVSGTEVLADMFLNLLNSNKI